MSFVDWIAVKHRLDFIRHHGIEILRNCELSLHKADRSLLRRCYFVERHDFHHRLARLGYDGGFALGGFFDQPRKVDLCFADVDRFHIALQMDSVQYVWSNQPSIATREYRCGYCAAGTTAACPGR